MDFQKLFDEYNFSEAEKELAINSKTANTSEMNRSRVISELILNKRIEKATYDIINSNKKLAISNEKYSKGLLWLTGGLVFVGLVQIIINIIK